MTCSPQSQKIEQKLSKMIEEPHVYKFVKIPQGCRMEIQSGFIQFGWFIVLPPSTVNQYKGGEQIINGLHIPQS